ncbi:MAG: hypothetical protein Q4C42_01885 [Clostridia bacterium]|nr:hypothetical protein [Clostridia bacterium]
MSNIRYGLQMFGCSADFRKDTDFFFKTMKDYGYSIIEPCIIFGEDEFRANAIASGNEKAAALADLVWTEKSAPKFYEDMKKYGLELVSAHVFGADYEKMMPMMKEFAKTTGLKSYVINIPQQAIDEPFGFVKTLDYVADELESIGVELWLHNSGNDFRKKVNTEDGEMFVYEYLLTHCEKAWAQVDTGWVMPGGIEPQDFMKKYESKLRAIHFKDLHENFDELGFPKMFAILGEGRTDVKVCMELAPQDGSVPVYIDQDMPISGDIFADMKKSIDLLHSLEK